MTDSAMRRSAITLLDPPKWLRFGLFMLGLMGVLALVQRDAAPIVGLFVIVASLVGLSLVYVYAWRLSRRAVARAVGFRGDPAWLLGVDMANGASAEPTAECAHLPAEFGFDALTPSQTRWRLVAIYAAGSIARLALFTPFLVLGALAGPLSSNGFIFVSIGLVGLLASGFDVLPVRLASRRSDCAAVLALFRAPRDDVMIVVRAIGVERGRGKALRDWQPELLWQARLVLRAYVASAGYDARIAARLSATLYTQALAAGALEDAEASLSQALGEVERVPDALADALRREAAFFYADRRGAAAAARAWLQQACPVTDNPLAAARAEAAVLLAETNFTEAATVAARALSLPLALQEQRDGVKGWEREQLQRIADEAQRVLAQREAAPA